MGLIVLDASAGADLLLRTHTGRALRRQLPSEAEYWVPEHYLVEVAGVLRRAGLREVAPAGRIERAIDQLIVGQLHRVQVRALLRGAWARRGHLTIADAIYVVLAEEIRATLVTSDVNLAKSPGLRVPTITP